MPETRGTLHIVGAGPAGLAAGITAARAGAEVIVHEKHADVGHRFHEDFQGLENWTTGGDVLDELRDCGIEADFEHVPFRALTVFGPDERPYELQSDAPLWYLIRRGRTAGTLDRALADQARTDGVRIVFDDAVEHLSAGGIMAHGPRRADVIAVGYVFETDLPDGAYAAISDDLAPSGYAYLLIAGGRATLASCLFDDFHHDRVHLERCVEFFRRTIGVRMHDARRFGGFGNVYDRPVLRRGPILYAGEAAGLQDALFGFGLRFAMLSGSMAATAWLAHRPQDYETACRARFGNIHQLGIANRYLFERAGAAGHTRLLQRIHRQRSPRRWLQEYHGSGPVRALLARLIRHRYAASIAACEALDGCDCTRCRCTRGIHHATT